MRRMNERLLQHLHAFVIPYYSREALVGGEGMEAEQLAVQCCPVGCPVLRT